MSLQSQQPKAKVLEFQRRQPDSAIVGYLEKLLEDARRGELVGIMIATHYGGKEFGYTGAGTLVSNPALGLGATLRLTQKLL